MAKNLLRRIVHIFSFLQDSFETITKTFMKVTAMTTGEIEYTPIVIDNLNQTRKIPGRPEGIPLVPFEDSTYIFYYMFILVMPIALVNLLVSQTLLSSIPTSNSTVLYN